MSMEHGTCVDRSVDHSVLRKICPYYAQVSSKPTCQAIMKLVTGRSTSLQVNTYEGRKESYTTRPLPLPKYYDTPQSTSLENTKNCLLCL